MGPKAAWPLLASVLINPKYRDDGGIAVEHTTSPSSVKDGRVRWLWRYRHRGTGGLRYEVEAYRVQIAFLRTGATYIDWAARYLAKGLWVGHHDRASAGSAQ